MTFFFCLEMGISYYRKFVDEYHGAGDLKLLVVLF